MKLEILENIPEKLKIFEGKKIRTLIDSETKELWFIAQDVLRILQDNPKPDVSNATKDLDSDEKGRFKIVSTNSEDIRLKDTTVINESGLYSLILRSRKPVAKPFQRFVTKEVLPEIRKNGYYIKDNLTDEQEIKLVTEVVKKYDRRFIDLRREAMIEFVIKYLVDEGYTKRQANSLLASIYGVLHAAILGKTASKIVYDIMMDDKLANIQTYNTLRKIPKIYSRDHATALNFYNTDQLNEFGEHYEHILSSAVSIIRARRVKPTPLRVRDAVDEQSKIILKNFSGLENGEVLKGINRTKLNKAIDKLYKKGFILSEEEKDTVRDELMSLKSRSYKISF